MGNPHAVIAVESVARADVGMLGAAVGTHAAFPEGVNVGFVERTDSAHLRLRVFERGVGETLACGTGAAAAMAVGRRYGDLDETVQVSLPGGVLSVSWPGPGEDLWQTGPASTVYEGTIQL
jgi:diaminopimelate epimerase